MTALNIALGIIRKFEGCRLKAYPDPGTGGEPWTIGYGNTYYEDGSKVKQYDVITQDRADLLLRITVIAFHDMVKEIVPATLTDNQLAALISFTYNVGTGNLKKSTLLKKVQANPNDKAIAIEFMRWTRAAGKVLEGLKRRRAKEAEIYFT